LKEADLRGARLIGANLEGANLSRALLERADFSGANLFLADLTNARSTDIGNYLFNGVDFAGAFMDDKLRDYIIARGGKV
jgi:uncharacterized protein YjbI with pentapeptide repeats